jgi:raffinose/stachyose/melibiose transport system permease protein
MRSSAIVSSSVVAVSTLLSTLGGYAFGTMRFRGDKLLFYVLLLGLILPYEAVIIPLYYDERSVGLVDTYWGLILPEIGFALPFGIFWMRAFFLATPRSLIEAARLDGASSWGILWRILIPFGKPAILTLVVLLFMSTWNEFLLALVLISNENLRTAPLGLAWFQDQYTIDPTGLAAGAAIIALPIVLVYVFLQRHFIRGMLSGALKG